MGLVSQLHRYIPAGPVQSNMLWILAFFTRPLLCWKCRNWHKLSTCLKIERTYFPYLCLGKGIGCYTDMCYVLGWIWGICPMQQISKDNQSLILKPCADATRCPEEEYQWQHKITRSIINHFFFKNNIFQVETNINPRGAQHYYINISNDRSFGCLIMYTDIFSQQYFVHRHLQQYIIPFANYGNIFNANF